MTDRQKKGVKQIVIGVILLVAAGLMYWYGKRPPEVMNFDECAEAGYPVMESYPRQCKTPAGETFKEDIGNELEKDELIRIESPRPNAIVKSPLTIKGMARGDWFFEASFPLRLFDGDGKEIAVSYAQANGEWMTSEFVPFEGKLIFTAPSTDEGTLILEKDNPSGLPEHADELRVPVAYK